MNDVWNTIKDKIKDRTLIRYSIEVHFNNGDKMPLPLNKPHTAQHVWFAFEHCVKEQHTNEKCVLLSQHPSWFTKPTMSALISLPGMRNDKWDS